MSDDFMDAVCGNRRMGQTTLFITLLKENEKVALVVGDSKYKDDLRRNWQLTREQWSRIFVVGSLKDLRGRRYLLLWDNQAMGNLGSHWWKERCRYQRVYKLIQRWMRGRWTGWDFASRISLGRVALVFRIMQILARKWDMTFDMDIGRAYGHDSKTTRPRPRLR